MTEIVFVFPTAETPGFLKRQRAAVVLQSELASGATAETIEKLVEFLLQFVKEPEDRTAAAELIWDMPQGQFEQVLKQITESATSPKD